MAIHVQCAGCGAKFQALEKLAGKRAKCPECSAAITVPRQPEQTSRQAVPSQEEKTTIVVTCDCGKKLRAKAELAGKRVKCPACGEPLNIPGSRSAAVQPANGLDLDLDLLAGAVADAEAMPSSPLRPLVKKKQSSNTGLIVGLSVGAGAAGQDDEVLSLKKATEGPAKKPIMPPSRIAFLVFVIVAGGAAFMEWRAKSSFSATVEAVGKAFGEAQQRGDGLYREDLMEVIKGSYSTEKNDSARTEIFTWRGIRAHRLQVQYGSGEFVRDYKTLQKSVEEVGS
jgi:DNA-directed RNA polymerase subunit RPC12/RpoP